MGLAFRRKCGACTDLAGKQIAFDVMTNGFGAMPDYRAQIAPRDRWAIAAYIRALQLSQHASAVRRAGRGSAEALAASQRAIGGRGQALMQTYAPPTASAELDRLQQRGLIVGVAGAVLGAIGVILSPAQFLPSWLIGFVLCLGLTLGWLALLMLQHMTGGKWGLVSRRIFEAGEPSDSVLRRAVPSDRGHAAEAVCLGAAGGGAADEILQFKQIYLNVPFFLIRAVVYFVVWMVVRDTAQQVVGGAGSRRGRGDRSRYPALPRRQRARAAHLRHPDEPGARSTG